jgi:hypothetical protein
MSSSAFARGAANRDHIYKTAKRLICSFNKVDREVALLCEFHVAGLAGVIVTGLAPVPFNLDDAAIHFDDGAQLIAILARNALANFPVRAINLRFHAGNFARKSKLATHVFMKQASPAGRAPSSLPKPI